MFHSLLSKLARLFAGQGRSRPRTANVTLGVAANREARNPFVALPAELRTQHLGIMGLSGSGKSYLIEHMIRQDVQNGVGFVLFDVHGDLAETVIAYLAERRMSDPQVDERTAILEPFDPAQTFGFNPLERRNDTSAFLQAKHMAYILRKRWLDSTLGARTEELLQHSLYTLSSNGLTLLELPRLLSDRVFRAKLTAQLPSSEVRAYWYSRYGALSAKMQAAVREPLLTRVSGFVSDPQVRDVVGQVRSTISFRDAVEKGLWVIVNLAKGRLGENSTVLGSLLFASLELDIMALTHISESTRKLFAVYADEVQNLASDSFEHLIAEARKYRVALVSGHQFWNQLDPTLQHAMLAMGSKAYFRLHYHDAVALAGELSAKERSRYIVLLTGLGRGEAIVRIGHERPRLINVPAHPRARPSPDDVSSLRAVSARRYARPRDVIEREISERKTAQPTSRRRPPLIP